MNQSGASSSKDRPFAETVVIARTTAPSAMSTNPSTTRMPTRSMIQPTGGQNAAPRSVAQKFNAANGTRSKDRSCRSASVIRPSPCVRPGSVATIAPAATAIGASTGQIRGPGVGCFAGMLYTPR